MLLPAVHAAEQVRFWTRRFTMLAPSRTRNVSPFLPSQVRTDYVTSTLRYELALLKARCEPRRCRYR
jgi:hypothetical protein